MPQTAFRQSGAQAQVAPPTLRQPGDAVGGSTLGVGLLAYYPFTDGTGSTVTDRAGGFNATWQGTLGSQWSTGVVQGAGSFNGTDNYVSLPSATGLQQASGQSRTFAAWVKLNAAGNFPIVISAGGGLNELRYSGSSRTPEFVGPQGSAVTDALAAVALSTWHHLIAAYDGTAQSQALYLDGVLQATTASAAAAVSTQMAVGARPGPSLFLTGQISALGIWSRALTAAEAAALYNGGAGVAYPF